MVRSVNTNNHDIYSIAVERIKSKHRKGSTQTSYYASASSMDIH